jgi:uncharacterized protein
MKVARFRFDEDLRILLQVGHEGGELKYRFTGPQSAKHLIESMGIPHTEIAEVRLGTRRVQSGYIVEDSDELSVWGNAPAPLPGGEPGFVLDGHLGRLNSHLRMLGLDCLYASEADDADLFRTALEDARVLLTRDRRLLMHKELTLGYLVRSQDPERQLREVVRRYVLWEWFHPFRRCIRCNQLLEPVAKDKILDRLEPLTRLYFEEFRICPACQQIYWKGSHFERMLRLIEEVGKDKAEG